MRNDPAFNNKMYDYTTHSIATATTNGLLPALVLLNRANYAKITSDKAITVRFNDTSYGDMPIAANTTVIREDIAIEKIYVTNASGATAAILVELHS